jgi:membrane protein
MNEIPVDEERPARAVAKSSDIRPLELVQQTVKKWIGDRAPSLAASLALYTTLSLAPLLVIAVAIAGLVFGDEAARGELTHQFAALVGPDGAAAAQSILASADRKGAGIVSTVAGVVVLFFGASGVFVELQDSLNIVWGVKPKPSRGAISIVRQRLLSFAMVLGVGFLLLVSLVLSAALSAAGHVFSTHLPGGATVWAIINFSISLIVIAGLFALIYRLVPDTEIAWHDVAIGAAMTSLLFALGKLLIGLYLGRASVGSAYGAAGSLVVVIVWVYYSSQILLLGAEFTRVFADQHGSRSARPARS